MEIDMNRVKLVGIIFVVMLVLAIGVNLTGWFDTPLDKKKENKSIEYKNAYVLEVKKEKITFLAEGKKHTYEAQGVEKSVENSLADIKIYNNRIHRMDTKQDKIEGKVLAIGRDWIQIESYGKVKMTDSFKVYKIYGEPEEKTIDDIIVGSDTQTFITQNEQICGVFVEKVLEPQNIRVLLHNSGYLSLFHNKVTLSCEGPYIVQYGKESKEYKAGKKLKLDADSELLQSERLIITPVNADDMITIHSVERELGNPSYPGSIEVDLREEGIILINEVSLEEYLYRVVPSEMPSSFEPEALKAQAVCARSYAYKHITNQSYRDYGAHVDDSTNFQVYNNIEQNEKTTEAVDATSGKVMSYDGEPISAYFFSTSCGVTTDAAVWGSGNELGYVKGVSLLDEPIEDLTDEKQFEEFITTVPSGTESTRAYYRWQVSGTKEDLKLSIEANIGKRYAADPDGILVLQDNGKYKSEKIETIGKVKKIEVEKRGTNGVVESVIVKGSKKTIKILKEYNIRSLLNLSDHTLILNDGTSQNAGTILPSGFFTVQQDGDTFTFYGGGFGHGVGMSQYGANELARSGKKFKKILKTYYNDIDFMQIY